MNVSRQTDTRTRTQSKHTHRAVATGQWPQASHKSSRRTSGRSLGAGMDREHHKPLSLGKDTKNKWPVPDPW